MREISRRHTRVVGAFPDGQSCLNLTGVRLRYVRGLLGGSAWQLQMKERYRGYVIRYYSAHDWLAFIYSPGGTEAVGESVRATRAEGEEVLLRRVRARIDADRLREDHYDS